MCSSVSSVKCLGPAALEVQELEMQDALYSLLLCLTLAEDFEEEQLNSTVFTVHNTP